MAAKRGKPRRTPDQTRIRKLLEEASRRSEGSEEQHLQEVAQELLEGLTPVQKTFVLDPSNQKAALCTRRAGKSWACKVALLYTAITQAYSVNVYVNTSRRECLNIIWNGKDGLVALNKRYKLNGQVNKTYLSIEFPNGAVIRLVGVDDSSEMEKLRGDAYDFVVVDESAKFDSLKYFFQDIIKPAMGDRDGTVALIGTPSIACSGYFFDVTRDNPTIKGWSVHRWTYKENTFLPKLAAVFAKDKKANGWADDHPTWLREFCGKWVKSDTLLVYAFNRIPEERRYYEELPEGDDTPYQWDYMLGADLGYRDAFAYSIWAYCENHPIAYEIDSFKESELNNNQQAEKLLQLCRHYDFSKIVIDGSPATIEAWRDQYGIQGTYAEKQHKHSYIAQWNAAMLEGRVKFRRGSVLAKELASLQWIEKTVDSARPKEDKKNGANDAADSSLYIFKELFSWAWEPSRAPLTGAMDNAYFQRMEEQMDEWSLGSDEEPNSYYEKFRN